MVNREVIQHDTETLAEIEERLKAPLILSLEEKTALTQALKMIKQDGQVSDVKAQGTIARAGFFH